MKSGHELISYLQLSARPAWLVNALHSAMKLLSLKSTCGHGGWD